MRIGQTSFIVFVSKVVGSALGFFAMIYFARVLGAEVLGLYALVLTVVRWVQMGSSIGFLKAIEKRVSEGDEEGAYLAAGILLITTITVVASLLVILLRPYLEVYIDGFDTYVAISVVWFIVAILFTRLFKGMITSTLTGQRLVHIAGMLSPVKIGLQSLIQIALVVVGFSLAGMLAGYALGGLIAGLIGLIYLSVPIERPKRRHFRSLFDYAKYSWLGKLEGRSFKDVDILLLGVFVSPALVGVYAIAWNIAKFLKLFGSAVSSTLFPEISFQSARGERDTTANLINDSLTYAGLFAIPGLVGGVILSERLLRIYGSEFVQGTAVLGLLILAILLYNYKNQLVNALNALDRPDIAFRVNIVFLLLNVSLNAILIWQIGWVGAAIATVVSTGLALVLSYYMLINLVDFDSPSGEVARQITSALLMGGVVWSLLEAIERTAITDHNALIVVVLVGIGAGVYFVSLLLLSTRFRSTVRQNLPFHVPFLTPR